MLILAPQFVSAPALKVLVPPGAIVAYAATIVSIPPPWALCDGVNGTPDLTDRFVIGADETYTYDTTGGAVSSTVGGSTGSDGLHTGPLQWTANQNAGGSGYDADGVHSHALSGTIDTAPESYSYVYIMATGAAPLPADAILWFDDIAGNMPAGFANETTLHGRFVKGVATDARAVTGTNAQDVFLTLASAGYHQHGAQVAWAIGGSGYHEAIGGGQHTDVVVRQCAKSLPPYCGLTAIRVQTQTGAENLMIAAYRGFPGDLPAEWRLCDGANGTPDLRGRMILGADGVTYAVGAVGGSGSRTATVASGVTHTVTHQHGANNAEAAYVQAQHTSYAWTHSHSIPDIPLGMPPWHALHHIVCAI